MSATTTQAATDDTVELTDAEIESFGANLYEATIWVGLATVGYAVRGHGYADAVSNLELFLAAKEVEPQEFITTLTLQPWSRRHSSRADIGLRLIEEAGLHGVLVLSESRSDSELARYKHLRSEQA